MRTNKHCGNYLLIQLKTHQTMNRVMVDTTMNYYHKHKPLHDSESVTETSRHIKNRAYHG